MIEAMCSPVQTGMAGVGFLQFCNLNSFRTKFILGFSLFMGLSVPQYFNEYTSVAGFGPVHTHARWVRSSLNQISVLLQWEQQSDNPTDSSILIVLPIAHPCHLHLAL
jgi:hypothetical protein